MSRLALYQALYRTDFSAFLRMAYDEIHPQKPLQDNWHLDLLADRLQACLEAEGPRRLAITMPPRSLKSFGTTQAFPAFALGRDPRLKIMVLAGSKRLSYEHDRAIRQLMSSDQYRALFPLVRFDPSCPEIHLPDGGQLTSGVVGQSQIGRGADIIIVDDPITPTAAMCSDQREAANAWLRNEIIPRLNNKRNGIIILTMQRLHWSDPAGHAHAERWPSLTLPAVAEQDEVWTNRYGRLIHRRARFEPLCPSRESLEDLHTILYEIGGISFMAQYQQSPYPGEKPRPSEDAFLTPLKPAGWKPGDRWSSTNSGGWYVIPCEHRVSERVFGQTLPYLEGLTDDQLGGCTKEEWQEDCRIQQARLIAATIGAPARTR